MGHSVEKRRIKVKKEVHKKKIFETNAEKVKEDKWLHGVRHRGRTPPTIGGMTERKVAQGEFRHLRPRGRTVNFAIARGPKRSV